MSIIEKRHKSSSKRYHALYTQSCVAAAPHQKGISAAVNDGEFTAKELKALEEKYRVCLYNIEKYLVDTNLQKTPARENGSNPDRLRTSSSTSI